MKVVMPLSVFTLVDILPELDYAETNISLPKELWMAHHFTQNYSSDGDIARIINFIEAVRSSLCINEYPSARELPELLTLPANQATSQLWSDSDGNLIGFAYVDAFHTLRFDLDWQLQDPTLEQAILAWGEACLVGKHPFLYVTSHNADQQRLNFFKRYQFTQRPESIIHMACSLDSALPEPSIPNGFTIRSVTGEAEAAAVAALHRAAFGTPHMTTERRLHMMRSHSYDPDMDLVAVTPDGTLAAYAMGQGGDSNVTEDVSYADLFATHPAFRSCGLAQALMHIIVKRLQTKGYQVAKLSTDSDNQAMQRVAQTVGFRITGTTLRFQRPVQTEAATLYDTIEL